MGAVREEMWWENVHLNFQIKTWWFSGGKESWSTNSAVRKCCPDLVRALGLPPASSEAAWGNESGG